MEPVAILGLAALLFVKEAGVPVPIPGDLLVLGAGVASAGDPPSALLALAAILIAGYGGGAIQFLLVRGSLRRALIGLLTRFGVPRHRLDALAERLRRGGARGVALARTTPGVRVPAIAASGLAALPLPTFAAGLVVGNTIFVGGHFALGFAVGEPALRVIESAGGVTLAIVGLVALAVLGAGGWLLLRRQRTRAAVGEEAGDRSDAATLVAWADACCPACLALAVIRPDQRLSAGS